MGDPLKRKFYEIEVDPEYLKDPPPITVYGARQFLGTPAPEQRWLIPGLLPASVPAVLASQGGLGKSYLSLQLCVALACGKPFLGFEAQPPQGAYYFGLEDPVGTVHRRVQTIVQTYQRFQDWTEQDTEHLNRNFAAFFVNWSSKQASSFLPDLMPWVEPILQFADSEGIKPGLFVLDTLARFSQGDENTVQALRPVLQACAQLAHLGYTPLMLHHVGKGQEGARNSKPKDKPPISDRMSTEWVRGSSAIVDNFRCVMQLTALREDEAEKANLDADKARERGYLVFGVTKLNGGQKADWRLLEQDETGAWSCPADGSETLAMIRGAKAMAALTKQMAILVDLFHGGKHGGEPDLKLLAQKHCGETRDPSASLRLQIYKLRKAGLLQKNGLQLTLPGRNRVQETGMETERTTSD